MLSELLSASTTDIILGMTTTRTPAAWELIDAAQAAGISTYNKTAEQLAFILENLTETEEREVA